MRGTEPNEKTGSGLRAVKEFFRRELLRGAVPEFSERAAEVRHADDPADVGDLLLPHPRRPLKGFQQKIFPIRLDFFCGP